MTYPLDHFSVSMDSEQPAKLLEVKDDPQEVSRWSLHTLIPAPSYIGALAVERHDLHHPGRKDLIFYFSSQPNEKLA